MVSLIIAFPGIVTGGIAKKQAVDVNKIQIIVPEDTPEPGQGQSTEQEDAEKALERELGAAPKSK